MLPNDRRTKRTQVLYVEDQPVNVLLMRALFERRPQLSLEVAVDVTSALLLAPQIRPSLLLLDLRLPDGDGCSLLQRLRAFEHLHDVPAIVVTAEHQFDPSRTGFAEIWHKPIDMQRVLNRLDHWLAPQASPAGDGPPASVAALARPASGAFTRRLAAAPR